MQKKASDGSARLYKQYFDQVRDDPYVRMLRGGLFSLWYGPAVSVLRTVLAGRTSILDWGCHHAPDACLIRARFGQAVALHGCDIVDPPPVRRISFAMPDWSIGNWRILSSSLSGMLSSMPSSHPASWNTFPWTTSR